MLSLNCSKIGTVRPSIFGPLSSFRVTHRQVHTNNDIRATILSSHPELVEESSRKRILEQYISECARLGIRQNIKIGKNAQALSPDGDDAKRMKLRQQHRVEALADLAELKASKKGGWWILPNPLAIMDWIPI